MSFSVIGDEHIDREKRFSILKWRAKLNFMLLSTNCLIHFESVFYAYNKRSNNDSLIKTVSCRDPLA